MFKKWVLTLSEKDFKLLHSLIAFGNLLHNLGPQNFIDCWHKVNLYAGEICRLILLVDIRLDFNSNKFCNATGLLFFIVLHMNIAIST